MKRDGIGIIFQRLTDGRVHEVKSEVVGDEGMRRYVEV